MIKPNFKAANNVKDAFESLKSMLAVIRSQPRFCAISIKSNNNLDIDLDFL